MGKVFEVDFRNRSMIDQSAGLIPTLVNNPIFVRGSKGYGVICPNNTDGLQYNLSLSSDTYSIILWLNDVAALNNYICDFRYNGGTGYIKTGSGTTDYASSSGTIYVNNTVSSTPLDGQFTCVIISGITLESSRLDLFRKNSGGAESLLNANVPYFAIYEGAFTANDRDKLYEEFLRAPGPISSPTVLRPRIPVDGNEDGCVLAYDFQNWKGQSYVPDLTGNGYDGTSNGVPQPTIEGYYNGEDVASYFKSPTDSAILPSQNFTVEAYARNIPVSVSNRCLWAFGGSGFNSGARLFSGYYGASGCKWKLQTGDGVGNNGTYTSGLFPVDAFTHVVCTYDGSNTKLWMNWEYLGLVAGTVGTSSAWFTVGENVAGVNSFAGTVKFVRFFHRCWSDEQIQAKYNKIARQVIFVSDGTNALPDEHNYYVGERLVF